MKKKYDAVATIGTYKDKEGNEKKRYLTIGTVFENEDGRLVLKLEATPCSPEWTGWVSFYPVKQREQIDAHNKAKSNGYQPQKDEDADEIPF